MIDEKDIPNRDRLETLYNKILQQRHPNTDAKATIYDIDLVLEQFKKLNKNAVEVSKTNIEHPVSAVIDYLMVEALAAYINHREDLKGEEDR